MQENQSNSKNKILKKLNNKAWPMYLGLAAGSGFALAQISAASQCTLTTQGRCSVCGGCVFAIGGLVLWALWDQHKSQNSELDSEQNEFYSSTNHRDAH